MHCARRGLATDVDGINCPWLYVGGLGSTFAAHHEDCCLTGVNYMVDTTARHVDLAAAFSVPTPCPRFSSLFLPLPWSAVAVQVQVLCASMLRSRAMHGISRPTTVFMSYAPSNLAFHRCAHYGHSDTILTHIAGALLQAAELGEVAHTLDTWTRLSFKVWLLPKAPSQQYAADMLRRLPPEDGDPHVGTTVFGAR